MTANTSTLPTSGEVKNSRRFIIIGALLANSGLPVGSLFHLYLDGALLAAAGTALIVFGGTAHDAELRASVVRSMRPGTRRERSHTLRWIFAIMASLITIPNAVFGAENLQEYYLIPLSVVTVVVTFAMAHRDSTGFYEKPLLS